MFSTSWNRASGRPRDNIDTIPDSKWMSVEVRDGHDDTAKREPDSRSFSESKSIDSLPLPAGELDMLILPTVIPHNGVGSGRRHEKSNSQDRDRDPPYTNPPPPRSQPRLNQP